MTDRKIITSRLHTDDLTAKILRDDLGFRHLEIPMEYDLHHPLVKNVPPRHAMSQHVTTAMWGVDHHGEQRLGLLVVDDPWTGLPPDVMPHTAADADLVIERQGDLLGRGKA